MAQDPTFQQLANKDVEDVLALVGGQSVRFQDVDLVAATGATYTYVHRGADAYLTCLDSVLKVALATGDAEVELAIDATLVDTLVIPLATAPGTLVSLELPDATKLTDGQVVTLTVVGANTAAATADLTLSLKSAIDLRAA